jgi:serine/threonine-protein kinase
VRSTYEDALGPAGLTKGREEATLAGETLANRYDVLELLGVGGMGAVYRARDRDLDELVALKVLKRSLADVPAMTERFRHEVKLARRVTHVNVARTFELGTADGLIFCTMELIEGESLAGRLERGAPPLPEAIAIACAVCDGLDAAHTAGVVHRDIKPDNILIAQDGRVVVADFGVAAATVAATGELSGTLAYMAPEQMRGQVVGPAADVYSLGIVLKEMTATVSVPPELAAVLAHATHEDRDARIPSAKALRRALEPWSSKTTASRPSIPSLRTVAAPELASIVVLAPYRQGGDGERQYLATAVHETVLAKLGKTPRLRVLPRVGAPTNRPTFGIEFHLADQLDVWVSLENGVPIHMRFPIGIDHVQATADAVVSTVGAELARMQHRDEKLHEAMDLFWRARHIVYRDLMRVAEAIEALRRARELAPDEPRIAAVLAIAYVRQAFFVPHSNPTALADARVLATAAVNAAPQLADGHIALGHLELTAGAPVRAASHFRLAIARAPHLPEAHEQLGRLLLEAGYIDLARARLDEALAIAPDMYSAAWEISRAYALEGDWAELDRRVAELRAQGLDRPMSRARYAWWRGQREEVAAVRDSVVSQDRVLWPAVVDSLFDIFLDVRPWGENEDRLFETVAVDSTNKRRHCFVAQLACEAAAHSGNVDALVRILADAVDNGLFDRHWMDRCPMLAPYRDEPRVQALRTVIAKRADAIRDALYGDHAVGHSETQAAPQAATSDTQLA